MKKIGILLSFMLMVIIAGTSVYADGIDVSVNGEMLVFDVAPVIENGRTLVPLRAIFEKLGAEIAWDGETKTITATKGYTDIVLQIGSVSAEVDNKEVILDVPAKIVSGRTMVPVRFVSEAMGSVVGWDGLTKTVKIESAITLDRRLTSDKTLTKVEGPYILSGDFRVQRGATVTVEAGTEIYIDTLKLEVDGNLLVKGTSTSPVKFYNRIVENDLVLEIEGGKLLLENSLSPFKLITYSASSLSIINSEIGEIRLNNTSGGIIENVKINGIKDGIILNESNDAKILNNKFEGFERAVSLNYSKRTTMTDNIILNCQTGIYIRDNSDSKILRNDIQNSSKYGIIVLNASYNNEYINNNFHNNVMNAKVDTGEVRVDMSGNYWGTHKAELVLKTIDEYGDNKEFSRVIFEPMLTEAYKK